MAASNLFYEANGFQVSKNEDFVELKIPAEVFEKSQAECLKYDSFCAKSPSPNMIAEDCAHFAELCDALEKDDSFEVKGCEEMFMKEFIDQNPVFVSDSKTIDLNSDIIDVLCRLESYQNLDSNHTPALLAFLSYKYSRPRLYSAMILDANLREKIREWQLQMPVPDSSLISLFHVKKDAVDEVAHEFRRVMNLNPPFMLDVTHGNRKTPDESGQSFIDIDNDDKMAVQVAFFGLKEMTQHLVKIMRDHEKEIGEADVKCITLEEMIMEMRADIIQLRHEREIAIKELIDPNLPPEEKSAMLQGLKKGISMEARLKRENHVVREERDRLIRQSKKAEEKNKMLANKIAMLERNLQETKRLLPE